MSRVLEGLRAEASSSEQTAAMPGRSDLEALLREAPDDDTLMIYADASMTEGDPRDELIALELQNTERRPLLLRWLASHLRLEPGAITCTSATSRGSRF